MAVIVSYSSDIVSGIMALCIMVMSYVLSNFIYIRLMGKAALNALDNDESIEISEKSIRKIRNRLGFLTVVLTVLIHIIASTLEFGLIGISVSKTIDKDAVILGGGRRFNTENGSFVVSNERSEYDHYLYDLSTLFYPAVYGCANYEENEEFTMVRHNYPVVPKNGFGKDFECTSTWVGFSEWTFDTEEEMVIEIDSISEAVTDLDICWEYESTLEQEQCRSLDIQYARGVSYKGEPCPVILVSSGILLPIAIAVTKEGDDFIYSVATNIAEPVETFKIQDPDNTEPSYSDSESDSEDEEIYVGTFQKGHLRSSNYSLGAILNILMLPEFESATLITYPPPNPMTLAFESIDSLYRYSSWWWESGFYDEDLVTGDEESWIQLEDFNGNLYEEYHKPTESIQYSFVTGEEDVTLIRDWFFVLLGIMLVFVVILGFLSIFCGKSRGFWTYDGLSCMIHDADSMGTFAEVGLIKRDEQKSIRFIRKDKSGKISPEMGVIRV